MCYICSDEGEGIHEAAGGSTLDGGSGAARSKLRMHKKAREHVDALQQAGRKRKQHTGQGGTHALLLLLLPGALSVGCRIHGLGNVILVLSSLGFRNY